MLTSLRTKSLVVGVSVVVVGLLVVVGLTWAASQSYFEQHYKARYIERCRELGGEWNHTFGCTKADPEEPGVRHPVHVPECDL